MRKLRIEKEQKIEIVYAESVNRLVLQGFFDHINQHSCVLFVCTQPFYEYFYEKFTTLFSSDKKFHWYICPNNKRLQQVEAYHEILDFIEEVNLPSDTLILGGGKAEIYHVCGQLVNNSLYLSTFIYLPTTMSGFVDSLIGETYLLNEKTIPVVKQYVLPDVLVYDTMLSELEKPQLWATSFYSLVNLAVTKNADLLRQLYQASQSVNYKNFSPYIETVIKTVLNDNQVTYLIPFGTAFTKAFYHLGEAHYLNMAQKQYIGFFIHLLWSKKVGNFNFEYEKFYVWFEQIVAQDLSLPEQMLSSDLAESIVTELDRQENVAYIKEIGSLGVRKIPLIEEMYEVIEEYRTIKKNS
ncbi:MULTISPECIES: hypothetical protein [Vagococcus]|uniref:3-dehydroquinate synthase n=1 Tax=Vagococcus fluvialis bH819 TaxID=1255619 RepID=A0A1X6WN34_9ENTE|nr:MULTISPECIES: hypothetical protein [Vagococcus]SLM85690.1 hypothetical protein FM121_06295 [Vagococcus fluvialis bH819]HCM90112.1 hypothetical protein [Vagococcus sp.]